MIFKRKNRPAETEEAAMSLNGIDDLNLGKVGNVHKRNLKSLEYIQRELGKIRRRSEIVAGYESALEGINESRKILQKKVQELQAELDFSQSELNSVRRESESAKDQMQRIKGIQIIKAIVDGVERDVAKAVSIVLKEKDEKIAANGGELDRLRSFASKLAEIDEIKVKYQLGLKKLLDSRQDKDPRIPTLLATVIQYSLLELATSARNRRNAKMIVMANNLFRIADQLGRPLEYFNNQEFMIFMSLKDLIKKSFAGCESIERFVPVRKTGNVEMEDVRFYFEKILKEIRSVDYGAIQLKDFCVECLDDNTILIV